MTSRIAAVALMFFAGIGIGFAQDVSNPKILHINAHSRINKQDSINQIAFEYPELVCLSLTDSTLFDNFDQEIEKIKEHHQGHKLIVAVDRKGVSQKTEFMINFYNRCVKIGHHEAYNSAFSEIKRKYDTLYFKSAFFDLTTGKK